MCSKGKASEKVPPPGSMTNPPPFYSLSFFRHQAPNGVPTGLSDCLHSLEQPLQLIWRQTLQPEHPTELPHVFSLGVMVSFFFTKTTSESQAKTSSIIEKASPIAPEHLDLMCLIAFGGLQHWEVSWLSRPDQRLACECFALPAVLPLLLTNHGLPKDTMNYEQYHEKRKKWQTMENKKIQTTLQN